MKPLSILFLLTLQVASVALCSAQKKPAMIKFPITIAVHGGAGNLKKLALTPEQEAEYKSAIQQALDSGYQVLKNHGSSLDAVVAAVRTLEDNPLFNAGKGSVLTHEGRIEMDAAIMTGESKRCGAVAGVTKVKNPITAALAVYKDGNSVFLSGPGADAFAEEKGLETKDAEYFITPHRREQLRKALEKDELQLDYGDSLKQGINPSDPETKFGTVGCVALDEYGNLASATSTGGITNKRYGRIGDSPVIGAGTYADNKTCAVSCTGKGEDFIRLNVAYDISALMKYKQLGVSVAAEYVIKTKLVNAGGRGGCIAIDRQGRVSMPFSTTGMFRGFTNHLGKSKVLIY